MPLGIKKADIDKFKEIKWSKTNCYTLWSAILFNKEYALMIAIDCEVSMATIGRICDPNLYEKRINGLLSVKPIHYIVWERLYNAYLPIIQSQTTALKATRAIIESSTPKKAYSKGIKIQKL